MKAKILLSLLFTAIILLGRLKVASGSTILFSDDFNDNVISNQFQVKNYTLEDSGSFGPFSDLALVETGGEIKISGSGSIDTATVDGQVVGWIGRSLILDQQIQLNSPFAIESQVKIIQGTSGFVTHLTIEFDADNRITSSLGDTTTNGQRFAHLSFDEFNTGRCIGCQNIPYSFANNQTLTLRLEFDPASGNTKFFIDGNLIVEDTYQGSLVNPRVGLSATVRFLGSTIDARFDNLVVETFGSNILPVPDLKQFSPPWNGDEYNNASVWSSNPIIERWGCALTTASMVLQYHGHNINPDALNDWLNSEKDGYIRNGLLNWLAVSRYTNINADADSPTLEFRRFSADDTTLSNEIDNQRPPIVKVPGHFAVVKGKNNSDFLVNDPASSTNTLLSEVETDHGGPYSQINSYQPSSSDLSYIFLVINSEMSLKVFDPTGSEIEGLYFIDEPLTDDGGGSTESGNPLSIFLFPTPEDGNYKIEISGPQGLYTLDSYLYDEQGEVTTSTHEGLIDEGQKDEYSIVINESSNTSSVVTISSIIDDFDSAFNQGLIRNRGLYRALRNLLSFAQRLHEKGYSNYSKKLLKSTLRYTKRFTPRFIDPTASEILQINLKTLISSI